MDTKSKILEAVSEGTLGFAEAVARLAAAEGAVTDLGVARIDHARMARCGMPEFVYGAGKTVEQLLAIVPEILRRTGSVLVTRVEPEAGRTLRERVPQGVHDPVAKVFAVQNSARELRGNVAVVSAGTSDLGVALEAKYTLEECGVHFSAVAGTSIGSIVGAFYAKGYSPRDISELLRRLDYKSMAISVLTAGSNLSVRNLIDSMLDESCFSDLTLPFAAVLTP